MQAPHQVRDDMLLNRDGQRDQNECVQDDGAGNQVRYKHRAYEHQPKCHHGYAQRSLSFPDPQEAVRRFICPIPFHQENEDERKDDGGYENVLGIVMKSPAHVKVAIHSPGKQYRKIDSHEIGRDLECGDESLKSVTIRQNVGGCVLRCGD
jgi:hypothetical protein